MSPAECMRIQGISARQTSGLPDTFIRACVGNSMSVSVVSTIIDGALALVNTVKLVPLDIAQSATIENSRREPERLPSSKSLKPVVPHKDSSHFGILEHKRPLAIKAHEFATLGKKHLGNIHNKLARLKQPLVLGTHVATSIIERTNIRGPAMLIIGSNGLLCEDLSEMENGKASSTELICSRIYFLNSGNECSVKVRGKHDELSDRLKCATLLYPVSFGPNTQQSLHSPGGQSL